ncbi:MAG TPA: hypothetical protein VFW87_18800 [Pirellulales bacterium]|nr:hypothetical protein [Pirellulales bacterium]
MPTLRGLASLERAAPSAVTGPATGVGRRSGWGLRQGLVFLGLVLVAGSLLFWLLLWSGMPPPPGLADNYRELNREFIGHLTPETLLAEWDRYRKGIAEPEWSGGMEFYLSFEQNYYHSLTIVGIIAAVGIVILIIGLCVRRPHGAKPGNN